MDAMQKIAISRTPGRTSLSPVLYGRRSLTWLALLLLVGGFAADARAQNAFSPVVAPDKVQLNYLQSNWAKVLQDVAKAGGKSLIADHVPAKEFSRWDRKQYSFLEAVKILNRELEPEGFRLIVKGDYLILMELPAMRNEYPRPEMPAAKPTQVHADQEAVEDEPPLRTASKRRTDSRRRPTPGAQPVTHAAATYDADDEADEDEAAPQRTLLAVSLRQHAALSLARVIYSAFKPHANLVDEGPDGQHAFRVYQIARDQAAPHWSGIRRGPLWFEIGIDSDEERLLVDADPETARNVVRLIKLLDSAEPEQAVKVFESRRPPEQVAELLRSQIEALLSAGRRRASQFTQISYEEAEEEEFEQPEEAPRRKPADKNEPKDPARARPPANQERRDLPGLMQGLRGDVKVESIPGLGVLILKGNQKDVDAVMAIIREIERLSAQATPEAHLLLLQQVNSETLAPLLTSVYEKLGAARGRPAQGTPQGNQGQNQNGQTSNSAVIVLPVARPNAILVIGPKGEIADVLKLAEQLDQPNDPATEFRVFALRRAVAAQVVEMLNALYPAQAEQQSAAGTPRLRVTADIRTNSVIVQARPRDLKEIGTVIQRMDKAEPAALTQMRVIRLKFAIADELAATLQMAIQAVLNPPRVNAVPGQGGLQGGQGGGAAGGAGGGPEQLRDPKSASLQFMTIDGVTERTFRSGILADIRISSDPHTNSLVITAPEESMPLMEELVHQFDKPTSTVAEIKVFSLANGDATAMSQLLERLFNVQQTGAQNRPGAQQQGLLVAGGEEPSSGLVPLRFSVDVRTNSIIAVGGASALSVVEAVLLRLDESDIRQRQTAVYRLKNSPAVDIANAINQFLQTQRQVVTQNDPNLISPFEQIEREVVVVPETVRNNLLISATPRYFKDIEELVTKLDAAPAQVLIQALLVEVDLNNTDEFGMELGLQDSVLFRRSVGVAPILGPPTTTTAPNGVQTTTQTVFSQTSTPGFLFNNQTLGNNTNPALNPGEVGTQGVSNFALNRINNGLGYGGLVLAASSDSVSFMLRALSARRRVDILSRPQIRTLDNQLAQIQVGQEIPRVNSFSINGTTGQATPLVEQRSVGIILAVTPRISPDNVIVMEVAARKDALSANTVQLFVNPNGSVVNAPIVDTQNALATVSVRSGQTIVLGGMITRNEAREERKVPWLGDIPVIGLGFRYDLRTLTRTELLIFLTPRVIRGDIESETMKQIETQRIHFIEREAEQMHGPILAVPMAAPPGMEGFPPPLSDGLQFPTSPDDTGVPTTQMPLCPAPQTGQMVQPEPLPAPTNAPQLNAPAGVPDDELPPEAAPPQPIPPVPNPPPPPQGRIDPRWRPAGLQTSSRKSARTSDSQANARTSIAPKVRQLAQ